MGLFDKVTGREADGMDVGLVVRAGGSVVDEAEADVAIYCLTARDGEGGMSSRAGVVGTLTVDRLNSAVKGCLAAYLSACEELGLPRAIIEVMLLDVIESALGAEDSEEVGDDDAA